MAETSDLAEAHDLAAEALMVEYATRSYTDPIGSIKIPVHLKNMVFEWRAPSRSTPRGAAREASNLVNPQSGEFHTIGELEELIREGFDISTLDPPDESPDEDGKVSCTSSAVMLARPAEPDEIAGIVLAVINSSNALVRLDGFAMPLSTATAGPAPAASLRVTMEMSSGKPVGPPNGVG